ncbi:cilia-and flagella-associated protein 96 isoform X1 [Lampetra fluviatilis]
MPSDGKTDMERVGLFSELGYISIGDKYKSSFNKAFNAAANHGRQMLTEGPKSRSALPAGYFSQGFTRVMQGEAYSDPIKIRRQRRLQEAKKNLGKALLPSSCPKKPSGLGSYYGTLGGPIPALSPAQLSKKPYSAPGRNFVTNPPKKGTGYGYPQVMIGSLPPYMPDPYDRAKEIRRKEMETHKKMVKGAPFRLNLHPLDIFDVNPYRSDRPARAAHPPRATKFSEKAFKPSSPAKKMGGMKAGTFDSYPSHSEDAYIVKRASALAGGSGGTKGGGHVFRPSPGPKSTPVRSIMDANIIKSINRQNCNLVQRVMAY